MSAIVLPDQLLALTMLQPWPRMFLLEDDPKLLENRDWTPHRRMIGQWIALHGGRKPKAAEDFDAIREALDWINARVWGGEEDPEEWAEERAITEMCVSGIFAVARIARVVQQSDSPWWIGPYGWLLEDLTPLKPIQCPGSRRLWDVPANIRAQIVKQLEAQAPTAAPVATSAAPDPEPTPEPPRRPTTWKDDPYPYPDPGEQRRIPGLFCPGRAVVTLPDPPERGRLYGLRIGREDWATVLSDGQSLRWCCRSQPGEHTGGRAQFDTWIGDLREAAAAAAYPQ